MYLAEENGGLPLTLAAGSAPGESGVSVLMVKFRDGIHFTATPRQHLIWFQLSDVRIECRRAGRKLTQDVRQKCLQFVRLESIALQMPTRMSTLLLVAIDAWPACTDGCRGFCA